MAMLRVAFMILIAGSALALPGSALCGSVGPMQPIAAGDYVGAAQNALLAELNSRDGRFEIQPRGQYRDLQLKTGDKAELRARAEIASTLPSVVVWVDVVVAERVVRRLPVRFRVQWFKPALVARQRIHARTALSADMFSMQEVDVARARGAAIDSIDRLTGKRSRRELDAGVVLALADIEERPPVETGERISVAARVGRVIVHRAAIAQRDGYQGQRISARLTNSGETLSVKVIGDDTAEVAGDG